MRISGTSATKQGPTWGRDLLKQLPALLRHRNPAAGMLPTHYRGVFCLVDAAVITSATPEDNEARWVGHRRKAPV